jgi:hypothetical protein
VQGIREFRPRWIENRMMIKPSHARRRS